MYISFESSLIANGKTKTTPRWNIALYRYFFRTRVGAHIGYYLQCKHFVLSIPTCWYPKNLNVYPNPNANPWNIVWVGYTRVGHVDFMLFVSFSFALGSQCECGLYVGYIDGCNLGMGVVEG